MHKVDSKVQEKLWIEDGDQIRWAAGALVQKGARRQRGKTSKESLDEAVQELIKIAYLGGLARGYDMGFKIGNVSPREDDESDSPDSCPDCGALACDTDHEVEG